MICLQTSALLSQRFVLHVRRFYQAEKNISHVIESNGFERSCNIDIKSVVFF